MMLSTVVPKTTISPQKNGENPCNPDACDEQDCGASGAGDYDGGFASALRVGPTPWFPPSDNILHRIFVIFDDGSASKVGRLVAFLIMVVIVVSTVSFVLESMPEFNRRPQKCAELRAAKRPLTVEACQPQPDESFFLVEAICIAIFTVDYVVRILTYSAGSGYSEGCVALTFAYARQTLNIIDLLAILPFYINLFLAGDVGPVRVLRLLRILRLFKMAKHHPGMWMFAEVMIMSWQPLSILFFFKVILTVVFAALIFVLEGQTFSVADEFTASTANHSVPPRFPTGVFVRQVSGSLVETPFRSIPYAIWWVCVTMTTVGYGDFTTTTTWGKSVGVICFYVGIIFLALPISVLGTNFEVVYKRMLGKESSIRRTRTSMDRSMAGMPKPLKAKKTVHANVSSWLPNVRGFRRRLFLVLEDPQSCFLGKSVSIFMLLVILLSTSCFIVASIPDFNETPASCVTRLSVENCQPRPNEVFHTLEVVCIMVFTLDYVCRIATVHAAKPEECGISRVKEHTRLKSTALYAAQVLNIVDFLAIAPFYFELAGLGGGPAVVLRVLRLIRVFRVFKEPKMRACAEMFISIVADAMPALMILFFMTTLMCVFYASLIVFAEGSEYAVDREEYQKSHPEGLYIRPTVDGYGIEPSPFQSIVYAFWWFFTTATTVGYGDDYPTTTAGRGVAIAVFYTGIILLALPITIVGGAFNKFYPAWLEEFGTSDNPHMLDDDEDPASGKEAWGG